VGQGKEAVTSSQKRIVVTGGAGFLGRTLCRRLTSAGAEVLVPTVERYDLVQGDAVRQMYADMKPELVIHLAAVVGGIGANRVNPGKFFYENLMMGVQLLHEGWRSGLEKFVAIGTICAYPKFTPVPFREEDLWSGYPEETNAPYGLAKKMLLVQAQAYRAQYGFNAIFLLPVNLYGPGDNFDPASSHVIPALVKKFVDAREEGLPEVVLWGDGTPSREFLYVDDAAEGIALATERFDGPEPVNLGAGFEITIRELAERLKDLCGFKGRITWDASKPNGQPRRCLDVTQAEKLFGFKAAVPFDEGLKRTVAWYETGRVASGSS
jgi:GDP-L-fucose synthase